jgi:hypothetical protein
VRASPSCARQAHFMKNVAILGGLLTMIVAIG